MLILSRAELRLCMKSTHVEGKKQFSRFTHVENNNIKYKMALTVEGKLNVSRVGPSIKVIFKRKKKTRSQSNQFT